MRGNTAISGAALAATLLLTAIAAQAETEITYQLWGSPQEGEVWQKVAKEFEAQHPDIKVKVEVNDWDSYWEKIRVLGLCLFSSTNAIPGSKCFTGMAQACGF